MFMNPHMSWVHFMAPAYIVCCALKKDMEARQKMV